MEENNEIRINNVTATSMAHLIDVRNRVILEHGGVCTRLDFDKVEAMSLDTFKRIELAKLRRDPGTLTVIRNGADNEYSFILGDCVLRYKLTDISEAYFGDVLNELKMPDSNETHVTTELPWPLICKIEKGSALVVTVLLRSGKRYYNTSIGGNQVSVQYYPPDLWFKADLTVAGVLRGGSVCVVKSFTSDYRNTELFRWPLANVYREGHICFGGANMTTVSARKELYQKLSESISLFMDARFNLDLMPSDNEIRGILGAAANSGPLGEPYDGLLSRCTGYSAETDRLIIRLLSVMKEPDGWRSLNLRPLPVSAAEFVRSRW